jgi:hypothetical protein
MNDDLFLKKLGLFARSLGNVSQRVRTSASTPAGENYWTAILKERNATCTNASTVDKKILMAITKGDDIGTR